MFKIKWVTIPILVTCILGLFSIEAHSYGKYSSFVGKWKCEIVEKRESVLVELELYIQKNSLKGKLEILTDTNADITKGMSFNIAQVKVNNDRLSFIVPLFDEDADDSLFFQLKLNWRGLSGTLQEMRKGSEVMPITFTKARQGFLY